MALLFVLLVVLRWCCAVHGLCGLALAALLPIPAWDAVACCCLAPPLLPLPLLPCRPAAALTFGQRPAARPAGPAPAEEGGGGTADPKSFYLQELERYRQVACDSSATGDRPLVK